MICRGCNEEKHEEDFPLRKDYPKTSRRPYCHICVADIARARYKSHQRNQPFKLKASRAASKASSNKVPCDVDAEYLESIWTDVCPVFGDKLDVSAPRGEDGCAELDRFIPELGYVKGNVTFLSRKANRLKNSMTTEEARQVYKWMLEKGRELDG